MSPTEEKHAFLLKVTSIFVLVSGILLTAYTTARLGHGPFPFSEIKILKIIVGGCLGFAGWIMASPSRRQAFYGLPARTNQAGRFLRLIVRPLVFPPGCQQGYSRFVRIFLTILMFMGGSMVIWALLKPSVGFAAEFLQRWNVIGLGGMALAFTSGLLRYGRKAPQNNIDWPKPIEILCIFNLALLVTAIDIHLGRKIGLLAYPPYQDGVTYMLVAKNAFLHLGSWKMHPVSFANMMLGNRYPVWQGLMILNFRLFGEGEWQAYSARFWPTFVILLLVFWVVRRQIGTSSAIAAAIFTSLLPTLSLNLQAAAMGHHTTGNGYLADPRPDLLYAAFLICAVVLLVEHAQTLDEPTALLSGSCAALAVLTKASAVGALLMAWCMAAVYVLIVNRRNLRNVLFMAAWALLVFTILLLPWALAGGAELTFNYIRTSLTTELPLWANAHPTFRSELTYYWRFFVPHMGYLGLTVLIVGSSLFVVLGMKMKKSNVKVGRLFTYAAIGASLYGLVSAMLAKNYHFGLSCYFMLWVFSLSSLTAAVSLLQTWRTTLSRALVSAGLLYAGFVGIAGYRNLPHWPENELQAGPYNQIVMREMALDLRKVLSDDDHFMWMPAYGNPVTLLYYMPQPEGRLPRALDIDPMTYPPPEKYVREFIEPAKAVLLLRGDIEKFNSLGIGWIHPTTYPYFRAIAAWVHRPSSSHHLLKTYHFFGGDNDPELTVDLYVKEPEAPKVREQNAAEAEISRSIRRLNAHDN